MTGVEQIAVMKHVSQQAAGWLIGLSARKLRDNVSAPRGDDGMYHAAELVRWAMSRQPRPVLSDDETESLLIVHEHGLMSDMPERAIEIVDDLVKRHGLGVWLIFADLIMDTWRARAKSNSTYELPPALKDKSESAEPDEQAAYAALRYVHQCRGCSNIRRGPKWIKADAPSGHIVIYGWCPDCEQEGKAGI